MELQTKQVVYKLNLKLDFLNKPAEYFIIADTYLEKANIVALYNHLTGKRIKSMSIQMAKQVKDEFLFSVAHFRDDYEWIYNPPSIGTIQKHTIGKGLRQEFQEYYGAYAEITYLISQAYRWDFDKVNKMKLSEYLAVGEYLLRKRAVESVE